MASPAPRETSFAVLLGKGERPREMNRLKSEFLTFRDIFGGRSGSYQEVIDDMYREILEELRERASGAPHPGPLPMGEGVACPSRAGRKG